MLCWRHVVHVRRRRARKTELMHLLSQRAVMTAEKHRCGACDVTRSSLMRHQRRSQELRLGPISTILTGIQETGKQGRAAEHHGQGIKPATLISQACSQLHCKSFVVSSCCLLFLFLREVGEAPTHHRCHIKM